MSKTTSILTPDLLASADSTRLCMQAWDKGFRSWANSIPHLSPRYFWEVMERFRHVVAGSARRQNMAEHAAEEFLRAAVDQGKDAFATAVHFAISYRHYSRLCHGMCQGRVGWGHADYSDDSFGDLCDALPTIGKPLMEELQSGTYWGVRSDGMPCVEMYRFAPAVKEACPTYYEKVLNGENYFAMSLEEAAQVKLLHATVMWEGDKE